MTQREECLLLFNQIVMVSQWQYGRMIGYHEDFMDVYYVLRHIDGRVICHTGVGGVNAIFNRELHDLMDDFYTTMDCGPVEKFRHTRYPKEFQSSYFD